MNTRFTELHKALEAARAEVASLKERDVLANLEKPDSELAGA